MRTAVIVLPTHSRAVLC